MYIGKTARHDYPTVCVILQKPQYNITTNNQGDRMIKIEWRHWNGEWLIKNCKDDNEAMGFMWMCLTCGYEYKLLNS